MTSVPHKKFDPAKIARLDDPRRLDDIKPDVMWDALGAPEARTIVEIGSGTGLIAEVFATLAEGAVVYAVDTEQAMLDWVIATRGSLVEDGRIVPVKSTETKVPLSDSIADVVIMVNLHHELADPAATYAEAARLLRPGGGVLVVDWRPVETPKGPPLAVRADASTIGRYLADAGLTDVRSHEGLPYHSLVTARRAEAV